MVQLLVIMFGCFIIYSMFSTKSKPSYSTNNTNNNDYDDEQLIEDYIVMDVISDGELDGHI